MNDGLFDVSFGLCLLNTGICLLCCYWTRKRLLVGCLESGSYWNCVRVSVLLMFCSLRHTVLTPRPNDGLHFCVLALNVTDVISLCKNKIFENLFNLLFILLNWNLLKCKRVICLWNYGVMIKLELWHASLTWRRNDVKKDVHKDLYKTAVLKCRDNKLVLKAIYSLILGLWTFLKIPSKHV